MHPHHLLRWADSTFAHVAFYTDSGINYPYKGFRQVLAASNTALPLPEGEVFESLQQHTDNWLFGWLGYDCKNELEALQSAHPNKLDFPEAQFFEPELLIVWENEELKLLKGGLPNGFAEEEKSEKLPQLHFAACISRQQYLAKAQRVREHIAHGDVYELNLCIEWAAQWEQPQPLALFFALNELAPAPFSGYFRSGECAIVSASPERFFKQQGQQIISQPIKGTAPRSADTETDAANAAALLASEKERAENLMIVDLVRNDFARSSVPGTVKVPELFGIYSFSQVHQMISTVTGQLRPELSGLEALKNAFPMGSMTGAPKIRAMQIIEALECSRRGPYSGALGYFGPNQQADFNVLIRSFFCNTRSGYTSYQAGSALTWLADAEQEYEECMLKAAAVQKLFGRSS